MTSDDKNIYEKIWYDVKREAAKISGLSSGKIDKYEHLTSEEIFPSDHSIIIEQAKFIWKKKKKKIEEQGKRQFEALEVLKPNVQKLTINDVIPENTLSKEAKNELNRKYRKNEIEIEIEIEKTVDRENLV